MALSIDIENPNNDGTVASYWHIDSFIDLPYSQKRIINILGWASEANKDAGKRALFPLSPVIDNGEYDRDMTYAQMYSQLKIQEGGAFFGALDA